MGEKVMDGAEILMGKIAKFPLKVLGFIALIPLHVVCLFLSDSLELVGEWHESLCKFLDI